MDYNKQCWACEKDTMVSKGDYFQCSECGATWNWQPSSGTFDDIKVEKDECHGGTKLAPTRGTTFKKPGKVR
ncbi:hypothetical protein LCGC14_2650880 [marine sediment metagenome]|uniref:Uncharacterized protein n=1 Tax=marine sediment metagenome TaxID=412755 RepID=A0A0F9CLU9_9ZZZZ